MNYNLYFQFSIFFISNFFHFSFHCSSKMINKENLGWVITAVVLLICWLTCLAIFFGVFFGDEKWCCLEEAYPHKLSNKCCVKNRPKSESEYCSECQDYYWINYTMKHRYGGGKWIWGFFTVGMIPFVLCLCVFGCSGAFSGNGSGENKWLLIRI